MPNKMFLTAYKKSIDDDDRIIEAWASKPVVDRDDELIKWNAWDLKPFKLNPVLMLGHSYTSPPVGKILKINATPDGLKFRAWFATTPTADEIYQLYKEDVMRAFSVGFKPKKWEDNTDVEVRSGKPKRVYTDAELLEISCVSIPSCPTALIERRESGLIRSKALNSAIASVANGKAFRSHEVDFDEFSVEDLRDMIDEIDLSEIQVEDLASRAPSLLSEGDIDISKMSKQELWSLLLGDENSR